MCFDYCHTLDLLVTGSLDHMVCVWNPYVPAKPVAVLDGHNTTILNVIISKANNLIFSLSQDMVSITLQLEVKGKNLIFSLSQDLVSIARSSATS